MQNVIQIFNAEIFNAEIAFRQYLEHKFKDVHKRDVPNLFSPLQDSNLDIINLNEEISYKMRVFNQIVSTRNQLKSIIDKEQQIDLLSRLNGIILDTASTNDGPIGIINPYINIIENEIFLSPLFNESQHILIVYNPNDQDEVLKVFTSDEKEFAAIKICNLIIESQNDDEPISDLNEIITSKSIEFMESIRIPIKKHINLYNKSRLKSKIDELFEEYWDIDYMIVFEIENTEIEISQNEILRELYHFTGCRIRENSIEIRLNSNDDILGSQINPLDNSCQSDLIEMLNQIVWRNISFDYEDEIIQLLSVLSKNTEIIVRNTEFPKIDDLRDCYQKYNS